MNIRALKLSLTIFCLSLFLLSCGAQKQYLKRDLITEENDRESIPKPKPRRLSVFEDGIENIFGREIDEYGNLSWHSRKLINNLKQAKNTNSLDEVPNSTWFTNRHAKHPLTIAELRRGPNRGEGPDMSGYITITGAKAEGVSPGFRMKDSKGVDYFVKFDIKGFPQLNTAAEVITTKFVYASGYNTPENYLSVVDPEKMRIGEGVTIKDKWGKDVPMTMDFMNYILSQVQPSPDGTYRIVASKRLEGEPLGPFLYTGRRKDDPNDRVSHVHRRELRGYKAITAWLNNFDTKANNTLDMYVTENGKSFVKHYIIDFATSLGSGGYGTASRSRGHFGTFDLGHIFKKLFTLGLYVEPWEKKPKLISPSVGYFDSDLFNPGNYAVIVPNPAFQRMTELDGFWGAKIVMSFTDEQIRAIVETGEFQNQEDVDYIVRTLAERRDKTGRYWYGKVNPLDNFHFRQDSNAHTFIGFDDLSVNAGFENSDMTTYRYKLQYLGKDLTGYFFSKSKARLDLNDEMRQTIERNFAALPNLREDGRILNFKIESQRKPGGSWGKDVKVFFHYPIDVSEPPQIVAIEREN
ncbi:hypothetical protein IH879_11710 [candidate division KSB1 bacterium]|nr:hypothetical protein [candidate division KSB1 bacterium]